MLRIPITTIISSSENPLCLADLDLTSFISPQFPVAEIVRSVTGGLKYFAWLAVPKAATACVCAAPTVTSLEYAETVCTLQRTSYVTRLPAGPHPTYEALYPVVTLEAVCPWKSIRPVPSLI